MLNSVEIMGRLTRDPEIRYTQSQKAVASFTIACDRDRGEKQTDFIDCTAWEKTAEFVQKYFHKGSMIVVTGRLQQRTWEKDGKKFSAHEVNAERVYFGEPKNERG